MKSFILTTLFALIAGCLTYIIGFIFGFIATDKIAIASI